MEEGRTGERLGGKYRITGTLGSGGMGNVYCVYDERVCTYWAMKTIPVSTEAEQEIRMLRSLNFDFFPGIVDLFYTGAEICMVMELIRGRTLREELTERGRLPQEECLRLGISLAAALNSLHETRPQILYLDLKPENIMRETGSGKVKLVDFGSAVLPEQSVEERALSATPGYAAPELLSGFGGGRTVLSERCDIYSLGMVLFECLTGKNPARPPYLKGTVREFDASVSRALEKAVLKCMCTKPELRYPTMREAARALERCRQKERAAGFVRIGLRCITGCLLIPAAWRLAEQLISGTEKESWGQAASDCFPLLAGAYLWEYFVVERPARSKVRYRQIKSILKTERK